MKKVFLVRKGIITFTEKKEFNSFYQELKWKFQLFVKGCKIQEIK